MILNINVSANEDAQLVVRITEEKPEGRSVIDPIVLSRAASLRLATWIVEARSAEEKEAQVGADRAVVAPDGTEIRVVHAPAWSPTDDSWGTLWTYKGRQVAGPNFGGHVEAWNRAPTDAEVLADYEAWKAEKEGR